MLLFYPSNDRLPIKRHTQSVDQLQLSWRLLYEIRTRPSGPTKSFKSYGLTSKKSVYSIRLSPPLVTILIEDDNPAGNKKREEIFLALRPLVRIHQNLN